MCSNEVTVSHDKYHKSSKLNFDENQFKLLYIKNYAIKRIFTQKKVNR